MDTRKKTTEQFQQETQETLAKFTAMFEKLMGDYQNLQTTVHTIQQKNPGHPSSSGGGPYAGHGNDHKPYLKLHFPRFSGDDPTAWLYQAEKYFDFQKVSDDDQAHLAALHLEGIALQWHRWFTKLRGPLTWAEFSTALLRRFGPTDFEDPSEALSRLTQTSTVATYVEAFERLSHRVDGLPEVFLLGCFIGGLKDEIRLEVKIKKPRNLSDAISIAHLVENKLTLQRTPSSFSRNVGSTAPPKPPTSDGLLGPGPTTRLALPALPPIHRISNQEAYECHKKGLCYYCDERYVQGYKCSKPQLFMIEDAPVATDEPDETGVEDPLAKISFHAITGAPTPQTLRLPGQIKNKDVVVLVDGGSTHNFIDQALVDRFRLTVEKDTPFKVVVANREHVSCAGRGLKSSELAALKSHEAMVMHGPTLLLHVSLLPSEPTSDISPCTAIRDVLERFAKVRELLQQGLIRPSHSPFSSSFLLIKKADGSWRFCIDYRSLNDITVKDKYPIPVIDELLDELHGSRIYSKLDLRSGYHQIRVRDEDIHKTAFRTHDGHYEFVVMPFGLTNAPTTFQCLMNDLFCPFLCKFILVFFDDILVYSKTIDDHVEHLTVVLGILESNHLFAKQSKCCFGVSQGFGSIAAPLHKLVGKGLFVWDEVAEAAFQTLKIALTTTPTLGLPDWSQPFTVECDASGVGIGAVLTQRGKPLAYFSAPLKGSMLSWSTYEKEMLAVVKAVRKWRHYLLGRPFVVKTDHMSLKYLLEQRLTTPAQARWLPKLLGYDYTIEYKKGVSNRGADAHSRILEFHFMAISHPCSDHGGRHELVMRDGIWFRDGAILLCPTSPLLETVLALCHASPEGGHFGFHKTLHKVKQTFWWKGLKQRVKFFIKECLVCQRFKSDSMLPAGLLQPLPIPERVWEDISMDFVEGLPNSKGFTVVMVVVDRLSKYAHFIPLKHPFTAVSVAKEFVLNVVKLHGIPATVVSDRDKVFISSFWQALFKLQGSHLCMSSSYHPQTDGQTEVINRIMEQYLRCFTGDQPKKWLDWLPWAEYSYNTSVHSSTKLSPFQVVYGRPPPRLVPYVPGTTKVQVVDEYLGDRDALLRQLRANLIVAQNRMKVQADRKRREVEFLEGDLGSRLHTGHLTSLLRSSSGRTRF
ncbi:transposon ty3-G gag-pol polyprotein [Tanacetum coccineum]